MPRATVTNDTVRKDLKTLPGGFVVIQRLPFGRKLDRRQLSSNMKVQMQGRRRGNESTQDAMGEIMLLNRKAVEMDFAECILEHNLEDADGTLLDFKNPRNIEKLDPRVGEEIESYLNEVNNYEQELESLGNVPLMPSSEKTSVEPIPT